MLKRLRQFKAIKEKNYNLLLELGNSYISASQYLKQDRIIMKELDSLAVICPTLKDLEHVVISAKLYGIIPYVWLIDPRKIVAHEERHALKARDYGVEPYYGLINLGKSSLCYTWFTNFYDKAKDWDVKKLKEFLIHTADIRGKSGPDADIIRLLS